MKKKEIKSKKEIANIDLSLEDLENELKYEKYKSKYSKILKSTCYGLIIVAAISLIISTFIMPVLQISGDSMSPTYKKGDIVLAIKSRTFKEGEVIAFYHGNKILIKRVIAGANNWVNIDKDGSIYINGNKVYGINNLSLEDSDIEFPYQVPNESYFVLSDNPEDTIDSRNSEIGCIKNENIIGKIKLRIWPLN